jgi:diguanylate cyclase (GGDEF)-like protein
MRTAVHSAMHALGTALQRIAPWCDGIAVISLPATLAVYAFGEWHAGAWPALGLGLAATVYLAARLVMRNADASALKELERLRLRNERVTTALDHMSQGLCMFDGNKDLAVCNAQYAQMYGLSPEIVKPGTPFRQILQYRIDNGMFMVGDPEDYIRERIAAVEEQKSSVKVQHLTDGRSIAISHCPLPDGGWVATHDDITDIRRIEAQIAYMAHHDGLTDLPNRILFREELDRALEKVRRGSELWLLYIDLDHFKPVNDTLGHPVGDSLLKAIANRLREVTRGCDIVARLGGDEFAILQGDISDPRRAKALAERIIDALSSPFEIEGHQLVVGASVGIAVAPTDSNHADQLLKQADLALYRAKMEGRGVFRFFQPEMDTRIQERRALELDLRKALADREFEIRYQPLVNIETNRVTAFEALLRWHHPRRGDVPPAEFIPLAEEIGLMGRIGAWILKESCAEAAKWPDEIRLAVNLSPAQFKSRELMLDVMAALGKAGLDGSRLELEITESVMLQDTGSTLSILQSLHELGTRVSMDDFGTGYSSLSFLRKFPFDKIKIDQSFVQDLPEHAGSLAIVRAVLGLGSSLGIATTAEGVETVEQLAKLREEGCLEVQGYLFSPAISAGEIPAFLSSITEKHISVA